MISFACSTWSMSSPLLISPISAQPILGLRIPSERGPEGVGARAQARAVVRTTMGMDRSRIACPAAGLRPVRWIGTGEGTRDREGGRCGVARKLCLRRRRLRRRVMRWCHATRAARSATKQGRRMMMRALGPPVPSVRSLSHRLPCALCHAPARMYACPLTNHSI